MSFDVRFDVEIPVTQRKGSPIDGALMSFKGTIPFVPHPGMMIAPMKGDDFRKVCQVYWDHVEGLVVFFEFDEYAKKKHLEKLGWREAL